MPSLRAVISRARPAPDVPGLLVVETTVEKNDAMYTLVEQLTDATLSPRRRDLFTGCVRTSASRSMASDPARSDDARR